MCAGPFPAVRRDGRHRGKRGSLSRGEAAGGTRRVRKRHVLPVMPCGAAARKGFPSFSPCFHVLSPAVVSKALSAVPCRLRRPRPPRPQSEGPVILPARCPECRGGARPVPSCPIGPRARSRPARACPRPRLPPVLPASARLFWLRPLSSPGQAASCASACAVVRQNYCFYLIRAS